MHYTLESCLIAFSGMPLMGKGWFAAALIKVVDLTHIDIDDIRHELYPNPVRDLFNPDHTFDMTTKSYEAMVDGAMQQVLAGRPVLITGTFSRDEFKVPLEKAYRELVSHSIPTYFFLLATSSMEEIERRILKRQLEAVHSPIDSMEKFQWAQRMFKPIAFAPVKLIDTSRTKEECINDVLQYVKPSVGAQKMKNG